MSQWKDYIFGDIAEFSYGTLPKQEKLGIGNYPTFSGYKYQYKYPDFNCDKGDLIVVARGVGGTGDVKIAREKCYLTNLSIKIKTDQSKLDNLFFYYLFAQETLRYLDSGSAQSQITINDLSKVVLNLPPLNLQKKITIILSSLDNKIDLLHRQNTTLEAIAETLFRQWFVGEAKEDWGELTLGEVAEVQNGYAFSSGDYEEYQDGFLEVFKMGHIQPGGGLRFNPKADFVPRDERLKRWTLTKNDIVMAMTDMKDNMGILGHPALIDVSDKYVLNQRVARIYLKSTDNLKSIYLLYLQLNTEEAISLLQSKANSGVQVNLTTEAIKSIPVKLPPESVQDKVLSIIEPIFEKLSSNRIAVKTLEKLRDTLLPKLMSGEVRIQDD